MVKKYSLPVDIIYNIIMMKLKSLINWDRNVIDLFKCVFITLSTVSSMIWNILRLVTNSASCILIYRY